MKQKILTIILAVIVLIIVVATIAMLGGKEGAQTTVTQPTGTTTSPKLEITTPPDVLIIAMNTGDAVSLDPARAYEFTSVMVVNQIYDKLVDFEPPDMVNVKPEVAESWSVANDGVTWTFKIRKGIMFHSGRELTADDVVFSLQRVLILKQTAAWVLEQFVSNPDNIKKIDDYTVQIVLDKPVAPTFFLSALTFTTSAILDKQEVLARQVGNDLGSAWLTDHSAGSGPFKLVRWIREQEIVLEANPNYWRGVPKIKQIIIKHVPEPVDQLLMLKRGDVDIAWDLTVDQLLQLKGDPTVKILSAPSLYLAYIGMNVGVEPLSKPEVREAIRYCIDYDAIVNDILRGGAIKWQTIIPKGLFGALDKQPFAKNVTYAKELLAKAGYPNGFTVTLTIPTTSPQTDIAAKIQADLRECGITVNIEQLVASLMYEKYRKQGLQMVLAKWGSDYPDPDNNAKAFGDYTIKQLAWRNMWYDDYASQLAQKAAVEFDASKREQMYKELQEYILHNGPYVVLYQDLIQQAVKVWVKNFVPDPLSNYDLYKVYKSTD